MVLQTAVRPKQTVVQKHKIGHCKHFDFVFSYMVMITDFLVYTCNAYLRDYFEFTFLNGLHRTSGKKESTFFIDFFPLLV